MATATGCRWFGTAANRSEKDRRLSSPVRVSVDACSWVSAMTRSSPMRAPASLARVARSLISLSSTSASGVPVAWMTPTVRPMMDTGTHRADIRPCGRLRSFGHASRSSLSEKTCTCARRAAGQRSGESTVQPGGSPPGPTPAMRERWAWLLSASNNSTGESSSTSANERSITSMTSGSPSAMSSALARRLSNCWRCAWMSRIEASRSPAEIASRELDGQRTHLLVRLQLLAVGHEDEHHDHREDERHHARRPRWRSGRRPARPHCPPSRREW